MKDLEERCKGCNFTRKINSIPVGFGFIGCDYPPYRGKWIAEIIECPKLTQPKEVKE